MKGNNFFQDVIIGNALPSQSISNTTVNGTTIKEPWNKGRQISFLLNGGAFAASSSGRGRVQVQKRSDDSWVALKQKDGVTDLEFTQTALDDAGAGELGVLVGTIPFADVDIETYKAIRMTFQAENANAQLVGATYVVSDLLKHPSGQTDDLWSKVHTVV